MVHACAMHMLQVCTHMTLYVDVCLGISRYENLSTTATPARVQLNQL